MKACVHFYVEYIIILLVHKRQKAKLIWDEILFDVPWLKKETKQSNKE